MLSKNQDHLFRQDIRQQLSFQNRFRKYNRNLILLLLHQHQQGRHRYLRTANQVEMVHRHSR